MHFKNRFYYSISNPSDKNIGSSKNSITVILNPRAINHHNGIQFNTFISGAHYTVHRTVLNSRILF